MGVVDFSKVTQAAWLVVPEFGRPEFNLAAILFAIPVAIAPIVEHVGGILAIGSVGAARILRRRPACIARCLAMVWQSISLACWWASVTTYGEVTRSREC